MVDKSHQHLVSGFTSVNEIIAKIRIRVKFYDICLNCADFPSEEKDDMIKDAFDAKLENVCDKYPAHDAKIVLGDFNEKVGRDTLTWRHYRTVQPPREHYLQCCEADRFRRGV